eukprot:m.464279 g.464279  ORF g.464279 m.464279 type:complete len:87 (-) comp21616_c3_seq19:1135-1395(-)
MCQKSSSAWVASRMHPMSCLLETVLEAWEHSTTWTILQTNFLVFLSRVFRLEAGFSLDLLLINQKHPGYCFEKADISLFNWLLHFY